VKPTAAFHARIACLWEASARKIGNVHPGKSFTDLEYMHFAVSAVAADWTGKTLGETILNAVRTTQHAVGTNTNLGIVLLLAPLLHASRRDFLRIGIAQVLAASTVEDARLVYEAIRTANPGGMGQAQEQDVTEEPSVTLLEAMALAAHRDAIALQYVTNYTEIFEFGVPVFAEAFAQWGNIEAATITCQLRWLAAVPDSLIARKLGTSVAQDVKSRAARVWELGLQTEAGRTAWRELDRYLRSRGNALNPGTTADLVTACLFIALQENIVSIRSNFRWNDLDSL